MLALVGAPLLAFGLMQFRASSPLVARLMPEGVPVAPLVFVLHGALIIVCTGAGLLLGMLLFAMGDAGSGLGSRNFAFTLFVLGVALALFSPVIIVSGHLRKAALAVALLFLALFGWLMPYMAEWSKFDSA
jgi:hypothetical protein